MNRNNIRRTQQVIKLAALGTNQLCCLGSYSPAPREYLHLERSGNLCDVAADVSQPHDAQCLAVKDTCHWHWPPPEFDLPVNRRDLPHDRNH